MDVPKFLYHWSPRIHRDSIARKGITPHPSREIEGWTPNYVCASRTPHDAWRVTAALSAADNDEWDLWLVQTYLTVPEWEQVGTGAEWRTSEVAPSAVELVDQFVATRDTNAKLKRAFIVVRDLER
jgi:hypothetical protein